jgi:hypothetical protein
MKQKQTEEIKGYKVYLNEKNTEYVREFLESCKMKGGMSGFLDEYIDTTAKTLRAAGYQPGQKLTYAKAIRIGLKGLIQQPA